MSESESASESDWKLKAHLADKVMFVCEAEWAKPQVIMGIMEHAAVWESACPSQLSYYNPQTGGLAEGK